MFNRSHINNHEGHPHYFTDEQILLLKEKMYLSGEEEDLIQIIRHLSDATKFRIYMLLHKVDEISVTDVSHILGLSQSSVSHALSDLKDIGLVESHRCGQLICYSLKRTKKGSHFMAFLKSFKERISQKLNHLERSS